MQRIITFTLYLLAILVPLTFSSISFELFEFPKFILLLSGTLVISATWALHLYQTRDFDIIPKSRSLITSSILFLLGTQLLSTIFSIHPYTSFWGYYSRYHQGLLTTICYTIIYFAATYWLDTKSTHKLINISIKTSIFIGLIAILEHYNLSLSCTIMNTLNYLSSLKNNFSFSVTPSNYFTNACWSLATNPSGRVFSTLGQPNWLAAYLIPNIFLVFYRASIGKNQSRSMSLAFSFAVLFIALIFTKSRSGMLAFAISYLAYWLLLARQFSFAKIKKSFILTTSIFLLAATIFGTPSTPPLSSLINTGKQENQSTAVPTGTALENGGTESGDIRRIVWSGALKLIQQHPLLGTGPETFAYTYYWARPTSHNQTSEWDFLYNKAHNEYLNIAAGSGLLGLLAYLYFHYTIFATSLTTIPRSKKVTEDKKDDVRHFYPVLGTSLVGFAITNFFGFSVIPVYLMIIMIAAMPTSMQNHLDDPAPKLVIGYWLLVILIPLLYPLRLFLADAYYAKGKAYLDASQPDKSIPLLQKSLSYRPGLDLYHAALGEAYAASGQKDKALRELATNKALNPYHLNFYKSRAKIYLTLSLNEPAAIELENARQLAPTDPKLAYNLGLVYTRIAKDALAEKQLLDALALKPNYQEPYYALTLLYEQTKQVDKIPPLLESAKTNLATYSAQLRDKIEKYKNN